MRVALTLGTVPTAVAHPPRRLAALVVGLVVLAVAVIGCSSSPDHTYGAGFVTLVTPVNAATTTFQHALAALGADPTAAQVHAVAEPYAATIVRFDTNLLAVHWPAGVDEDVKQLVVADRRLAAHLRDVSGTPSFSARRWVADLVVDESETLRASTTARADLGLSNGGA